jgi:integrase
VGSYSRQPHLWRSANGYLYIVYSDRGRWRRKSTRTTKRAAADAQLREFLQRGAGARLPTSKAPLAQAAAEWLEDRSSVRFGLAAVTLKEYALTCSRLDGMALGQLRPEQVEPRDVREALQRLEKAGATAGIQARFLNHLRMIFRWLRFQERVAGNPAELVEPPRVARGRRPAITPGQFQTLRATATADLEAASLPADRREAQMVLDLLDALWLSGLRSIEAIRLRWEDVDLEAKTWRIISPENKGGDQVLPLHPGLVPMLRRRRLEAGAEPGPFSSLWTVRNAWQRFKRRHKEWTGWSLHSLRHGFVTRVRAAAGDAAASHLARHKSKAMTEHYSHFDAGTFRAALDQLGA